MGGGCGGLGLRLAAEGEERPVDDGEYDEPDEELHEERLLPDDQLLLLLLLRKLEPPPGRACTVSVASRHSKTSCAQRLTGQPRRVAR